MAMDSQTVDIRKEMAIELAQLVSAELLAKLLDKEGVSQRELAQRAGKNPSELSRIMSGTRNVTVRTLGEYLYHLGYELVTDAQPLCRTPGVTVQWSVEHVPIASSPTDDLQPLAA
ncbi:MAG: helix-turn-helix domain-containing protein [Planctomycetota bacterium]